MRLCRAHGRVPLRHADPAEVPATCRDPLRLSGAASLLSPWRRRRIATGSTSDSPAGTSPPPIDVDAVQRLVDASLDTHTANPTAHHVPPTVPATAPDGFTPLASAADAIGNHTLTGWRDHDWIVGLLVVGSGARYSLEISRIVLADGETTQLPIEQNAAINLQPTASTDVIAVSKSGSITGSDTNDTIAWWGWNGTNTGQSGGGADHVARAAAAAAQSDADAAGAAAAAANVNAVAAQRDADDALTAISALDDEYATDDELTAAVALLQASIDALGSNGMGTGTAGTTVYVSTTEPTGGAYTLDDVWIRDVARLQIYKWTGTVWAVTYTLPSIPDVQLLSPGAALGTPTAADHNDNAVRAVDGVWYFAQQTGHLANTTSWIWADLNDGQTDLAGWRGIVAEQPYDIPNPQALDWSYITSEKRWIRYASSAWQYQPAPAAYSSRYKSQSAAENGGLVTIGAFIFDKRRHSMRIIRSYNGAVPGAPTYEWHAFHQDEIDIENFALRSESIQVQARKLAVFPANVIAQIPNSGEKHFRLTARVHKNPSGDLTSYDLSQWVEIDPNELRVVYISLADYNALVAPDDGVMYVIP